MRLLPERKIMKIGSEEIKHKILRKLKKHNAVLRGIKYGGFADELANEIILLIGEPMNSEMKIMALARGMSKEDIALCEKVERTFGFDAMPVTPGAIEVYRWIAEREKEGQRLQAFVEWAKRQEEGKFIRKYRNDPSNIRVDWDRAFQARVERLIR